MAVLLPARVLNLRGPAARGQRERVEDQPVKPIPDTSERVRAPISVVIPTHNHGPYVVAAIRSALDQTPPPLEIIVVNDGSSDDTESRLEGLVRSGAIRYLKQANAGQAAARNAGAALALGRFLVFLDDDDLMPPDSLRWRHAALEADPAAAAVIGNHISFGNGDDIPVEPTKPGAARPISRLGLFGGNPAVSPGQALIRRDAFDRAGGFAEDIWGADDWDLWFRLAEAGRLLHVDRRALCYRLHASNSSRQISRLCRNAALVLERHMLALRAGDRSTIRSLSRTALAETWQPWLWQAARRGVREGRWSDATRSILTLVWLARRRFAAALRLKLWLVRGGRFRLDPADALVASFYDRQFFVET